MRLASGMLADQVGQQQVCRQDEARAGGMPAEGVALPAQVAQHQVGDRRNQHERQPPVERVVEGALEPHHEQCGAVHGHPDPDQVPVRRGPSRALHGPPGRHASEKRQEPAQQEHRNAREPQMGPAPRGGGLRGTHLQAHGREVCNAESPTPGEEEPAHGLLAAEQGLCKQGPRERCQVQRAHDGAVCVARCQREHGKPPGIAVPAAEQQRGARACKQDSAGNCRGHARFGLPVLAGPRRNAKHRRDVADGQQHEGVPLDSTWRTRPEHDARLRCPHAGFSRSPRVCA